MSDPRVAVPIDTLKSDGTSTGTNDRPRKPVSITLEDGTTCEIDHGYVVIAAITSCTNTSNPSVMIGAALLAKNAVEKGLARKPWVKTTLAPGSKVVMDYYNRSGLTPYPREAAGFNLVVTDARRASATQDHFHLRSQPLSTSTICPSSRCCPAIATLKDGINPDVKMNYLASPPLVVAYALAGTMDIDLLTEPLGYDPAGEPVTLSDIWPTDAEIQEVVTTAIASETFTREYADVFAGDEQWQTLHTPTGDTFEWDPASTYVRKPPYFDGMKVKPSPVVRRDGRFVCSPFWVTQ